MCRILFPSTLRSCLQPTTARRFGAAAHMRLAAHRRHRPPSTRPRPFQMHLTGRAGSRWPAARPGARAANPAGHPEDTLNASETPATRDPSAPVEALARRFLQALRTFLDLATELGRSDAHPSSRPNGRTARKPPRLTTSPPADETSVDATRRRRTGRPKAPGLLPASLIAMMLADLVSRPLLAMFSGWAREREANLDAPGEARRSR